MRTVYAELLLLCLLKSVSPQDNNDDACASESVALNTDGAVSSAVLELQTDASNILENFTEYCSILKRSCIADMSTLNSTADLKSACEEQGGKILQDDVGLKCTGSIFRIPIPGGIKVAATNFPSCVGMSCGDELPSSVTDLYGTFLDGAALQIEKALGDSMNCTQSSAPSYSSMAWFFVVAAYTTLSS